MSFRAAFIPSVKKWLIYSEQTLAIIKTGLDELRAYELCDILNGLKHFRAPEPEPKVHFNFDEIYAHYPKKGPGKKQGYEWLKKNIKTKEQFDNCLIAVAKYASHCQNVEDKFIKHFSTWVKCYTDWVDETNEPRQIKLTVDEITDAIVNF